MPKYLIERNVPGAGNMSDEALRALAQRSCAVLDELGPKIQWVESFVSADRITCVYIAPNEDIIREHASKGGFPADSIIEVKRKIDPTTAEVSLVGA